MKKVSLLLLSVLLIAGASVFQSSMPAGDLNTAQTKPVTGLNLGNKAPDIELSSPDGKIIKLSSLKGSMVLIDFWASWCGPCRYENPAVVRAYTLYKDKKFKSGKGFTIYSVSLDANPEAWKKAIVHDKLSWSHHVSDLRGWNSSAAARYGVTSIPANFLINDKGIIVNKNLRGEQLIEALEKLVVK